MLFQASLYNLSLIIKAGNSSGSFKLTVRRYLLNIMLISVMALSGCSKNVDQVNTDESMYFPPVTGNTWETRSASDLMWNQDAIQQLKDYLVLTNTKSFIIVINGRIVMEEYFDGHTASSTWPWNSAGKTLVTSSTGIAQQKGLLNLDDKVSQYIGNGWTSVTADKENLITIRHLLSMTTGLNDANQLVTKQSLTYVADAGTRWSYHNVFQLLMDVLASASGQSFESWFNTEIKNRIGMDGFWNFGPVYRIYHSTTRSMARFGILALNKGRWNNEQVIAESFFNESISPSQNINPSYGYLWWLNGKTRYMVPGSQLVFQGALIPGAPSDMYAAMGADDQRIYILPGKNIVIVRMGEASDPEHPSFALSGFDNNLWEKINAVIN